MEDKRGYTGAGGRPRIRVSALAELARKRTNLVWWTRARCAQLPFFALACEFFARIFENLPCRLLPRECCGCWYT